MKKHILVVDDDEPSVLGLILTLRKSGYSVTYTHNAADAFFQIFDNEGVKDKMVDLLIIDIHLPGMTGDQLIDKLHNVDCSLPTIAISGFATEEMRKNLNGKCDYFLEKPFRSDDLLPKVEKLLA